jgi:hypothetical protein
VIKELVSFAFPKFVSSREEGFSLNRKTVDYAFGITSTSTASYPC